MKREASITIRTPVELKAALEKRAKQEDRSLADEVIALLYRGMTVEAVSAPLPPDKVWKELLAKKQLLPTKPTSGADEPELAAVKKLKKAGKLETVTTNEALAMLGEPAASGPQLSELAELTEQLARGLEALRRAQGTMKRGKSRR